MKFKIVENNLSKILFIQILSYFLRKSRKSCKIYYWIYFFICNLFSNVVFAFYINFSLFAFRVCFINFPLRFTAVVCMNIFFIRLYVLFYLFLPLFFTSIFRFLNILQRKQFLYSPKNIYSFFEFSFFCVC